LSQPPKTFSTFAASSSSARQAPSWSARTSVVDLPFSTICASRSEFDQHRSPVFCPSSRQVMKVRSM
jgi:hypothetical protein